MKKKAISFAYQTFLLVAGSAISALAVKCFLIPQGFLTRGFTGVALLIYYEYPVLPIGVLYLLINIPVFAVGWHFVGSRFVLYSLWGMVIYSTMLSIISFQLDIDDMMLSAIIAGILSGIGTALILRSYGSSGGSDILCVIMHKYFSITLGAGSMIINAIILTIMALLFPLDKVLYTLVYVAVSMLVTNWFFHGLSKRQMVFIISEKWKDIADVLTNTHHIGVTIISGQGGYQGANIKILYSVINRKKTSDLKKVVLTIDTEAFITIMTAEDVTGVEIGNQPHW